MGHVARIGEMRNALEKTDRLSDLGVEYGSLKLK